MKNPGSCVDYYREPLHIGDTIIPAYGPAFDLKVGGRITCIIYSPIDDLHYITTVDEQGNTLLKDKCSRFYTTEERAKIRNNKEYVYFLSCYNDEFKRVGMLPLTNTASPLYDIPDETCFITLDAYHLEQKAKRKTMGSHSFYPIYFFLIKNKLQLSFDREKNYVLIRSSKVILPKYTGNEYKIFANKMELDYFIRALIEYFNKADLSQINNNKNFEDNNNKAQFEKDLILKLKRSNY